VIPLTHLKIEIMKNYRIEIKWAVIFTAMFLIWMMTEKLLGFHSSRLDMQQTVTALILIPSIVIYVLSVLDKKKNFYNGTITYRQSFLSGLVLTIGVVLLSPINQAVTSYVISPDYFTNATAYTVSEGILTQEQAANQFNIGNYIVTGIIGGLVTGTIFSAVISIFIKTKTR
jgi:hypothetical protein